jgi:NAD(P)-dependent dehydrogenase (short-subunit alcohol dehydrogenase family)
MSNRVALVTGGSSGIGRGIARRLAREGMDIAVLDVEREPATSEVYGADSERPTDELVTAESGVDAEYVQTDVSDAESVEAAVATTLDSFGRIDVLVNNAGIHIDGTNRTLSPEEWDQQLDVNLRGQFLTVKYAGDHLAESPAGRIVNLSSINATFGGMGPGYAASKAGIVNLTRDMAAEFAEAGVTANAVLPGVIKTAMQDDASETKREIERERTLLDRVGDPEDVAHAVAFFASERAEWITGAQLVVDGGYLASRR